MIRDIYVFVPGAWHSSWCWEKIVGRLEIARRIALAPDLPGYGPDATPLADVTLQMWTNAICKVVEAQPNPVVLVGHSRGGIIISQVAERLPAKIKRLVYINGFLLQSGQSVLRRLRADGTSALLQHATLSEDKGCWNLDAAHSRELFYNCTPAADVERAQARLAAEPAKPLLTPLELTERNFGRVPRAYIHCMRDRAVPYGLQSRMVEALPCSFVCSIDTDHSPFFSTPAELTQRLLSLAR